jgi:SAM-dependent methyltransferase
MARRASSDSRNVLARWLPDSWRMRLALAAPRLPVSRPITRPESAYDRAHFERFYAKADPWGIGKSENETVKYGLTLDLCGAGPFDRAVEIGCGEGLFTELLAPRCRSLLALDISSRATHRAQKRLAPHEGVSVRTAALPAEYPDGSFDLVVASDVLYFWRDEDLRGTIPLLGDSLTIGGRLVTLHYARPVNAVSTGERVHDLLSEIVTLSPVLSETRDMHG